MKIWWQILLNLVDSKKDFTLFLLFKETLH